MHRTLPRSSIIALAVAIALAAGATDAAAQRGRGDDGMRIVLDTTYRFGPNGVLDAEQVSGEIAVGTWDRPEVRVRAWIERGRVLSELSRSRVRLRVEGDRDSRGNRKLGDSRYEITVPAGTRVRAASVSGNVRVSGSGSEVEATSVSGDVAVSNAVGLTSVTSVSGDVRIQRVRGDLTIRSVSGDVTVEDAEGDVRASSVSGDLNLLRLRSRSVTAKSTSGDVDFLGTIDGDGRYQFTTHSGDVRLSLADGVGADVSVRTFSGELDSAFPITLGGRNRASARSMEFTLGNGGARITAETFSGDVTLRRSDGRSRR